jgi:hypothetical protein
VLRQKSELARNLRELHALVMQKGAEEKSVLFFRVWRGELRGPALLSLDENVPSPVPLDQQLHNLLDSLAGDSPPVSPTKPPLLPSPHPPATVTTVDTRVAPVSCPQPPSHSPAAVTTVDARGQSPAPPLTPTATPIYPRRYGAELDLAVPPWEHLSLLARWFYSSFREGELVMLNAEQTIPHTRLIRLCRKILAV